MFLLQFNTFTKVSQLGLHSQCHTKAYSETCQTSKIERFAIKGNGIQALIIFKKTLHLRCWKHSENTFTINDAGLMKVYISAQCLFEHQKLFKQVYITVTASDQCDGYVPGYRNSPRGCSTKKLFLKVSQYSLEGTCVGVSLYKSCRPRL